jgi:hypothetical protein
LAYPGSDFFEKDLKVTIQAVGGAGVSKVRELARRGLPLIPVSVGQNGKFMKLMEPGAPQLTDPGFPDGWVNFYRQDDYCATAYFYLDKPTHDLPPMPRIDVRINGSLN